MAANPLPKSMRVRLAELGQRLRRQQIITGLCRVVLVLSIGAFAAVLLDALVALPGWLRGVLLGGWLILGVREIRRFMRGPLTRPLDPEGLAAAIEQEYPRLGERLTTAVELAGTSDPAHGSPFLVDMLVRDAEIRTGRLDLKRAAPALGTLLVGLASVAVLVAVLAPLFAVPKASEHARRFFVPWYAPPIEINYAIKVTSGDPTVKRGESTTLSAVVEPTKPEAVLPSSAVAIIKSEKGSERAAMTFDPVKREAYLTRNGVEANFEYQIIAGDVQSEWHRVAVVDPVRLEGARITIVPPEYARKPGAEPIVLEGLSDLSAPQYSTVALELRFNRAPSAAWFEWKPGGEEAGKKASPARINVPLNGATTVHTSLAAVSDGEFRLFAEADKLKTAFRPMPLRVSIDAPPKFERIAGLTVQSRVARADEKAPVDCLISDDFGVSRVELAWRVNEGPVQTIELPLPKPNATAVQVGHLLDMASLAKDGDRLEFRVTAYDNRYVPEAGLQPQTTTFPPDGRWSEIRLSGTADSLKEQEIAAQKKDIEGRLKEIIAVLTKEQRTVDRLRTDTASQNLLKLDDAEKLDNARWEIVRTGEMLDDLARDASLAAELARFGDALRDVADRDVRPAAAMLRQAQLDKQPAPRTKNLELANQSLEEAIRKARALLQMNEQIARLRLDTQQLESIAARQNELANQTAKASKDELEKLQAKQKEIEDRLRKLSEESEPIRAAIRELERQQFQQAAREARSLEKDVRDFNSAMKNVDQSTREQRFADLRKQQDDLVKKAKELGRQLEPAIRSAPLQPFRTSELEKAADALANGKPEEAVDQLEKAAFELDRLANELEAAVARARDPREAARQLERLQEEFRRQAEKLAKDGPIKDAAKDVKDDFAALGKRQQALERAVAKLSVPPDATGAQTTRRIASELARGARDAIANQDEKAADENMQKAREALGKLVDLLPTQEKRLAASRAELSKVRQEQDAIAGLAEKTVKPLEKQDPDAAATQEELARRAADLAKRQGQAADRLGKLDVPGHEDRAAKVDEALRQAKNDLEAGRPQDIAASQQAARRELERLEQALSGQTPADEQADLLAKKQKELAEQLKRNAAKPDAKRTRELQQQQAELSAELQKLQVPEAPATKDDALALTRRAENAKTPQEAAQQADDAASALQRLADQINGRETEADRAARLAKRQKETAEETDLLAKKKDRENALDLRKRSQQILDEARHLRPGADAQKEKQQALEALNRAQQANQPEQLARLQKEAGEALQRLADKLQPRQVERLPMPRSTDDETLSGLPTKEQADEVRRLAEEQRKLRDELARANEQMSKDPPAPGKNPLEELIKEQEHIAQGARDLADLTSEKPEANQAKQAGAAAGQTAGHLKNGEVPPARETGKQTAKELEQLGRSKLDEAQRKQYQELAKRQEEVNKKLEDLAGDTQTAKAQQAERRKQLQEQAKELSGQMQKLGQQMKKGNAGAGEKAEQAAMHAQDAEKSLERAREQNAKNEREMARESQDKAAESLRLSAQNLENAADKMPKEKNGNGQPNRETGQSVETAREKMNQARQELDQGNSKEAGNAMRQAADALNRAARQMNRGENAAKSQAQTGDASQSGAKPGGKLSDGFAPDSKPLRPLADKYPGQSWGDLPGEIKNQIISDLKARYGEEYARYIKLYFEQVAERK